MRSIGVHNIFPLIAALMILMPACTGGKPFPQGWRTPTSDEVKAPWRNEDENRFAVVNGDFNGDGVIDEARLVIRKDVSGWGVIAFVSQTDRSFRVYWLDEAKDIKAIGAMGIKGVSPGVHTTACGKGCWDCRNEEVPEINIRFEGVDLFKFEGAESVFYWDGSVQDFKRMWLSD